MRRTAAATKVKEEEETDEKEEAKDEEKEEDEKTEDMDEENEGKEEENSDSEDESDDQPQPARRRSNKRRIPSPLVSPSDSDLEDFDLSGEQFFTLTIILIGTI